VENKGAVLEKGAWQRLVLEIIMKHIRRGAEMLLHLGANEVSKMERQQKSRVGFSLKIRKNVSKNPGK